MILWIKFGISAGLILIFGLKLSGIAHRIANTGRFSEAFMGVFFLALITSFPEVFTSIASVTRVNAPNLGFGDLIGSVILNLMVIAIIDFKEKKGAVLSIVNKNHLATCAFSLLTLGIILASLTLGLFNIKRPGFFNIGAESLLIIAIYIMSILYVRKHFPRAEENTKNKASEVIHKLYLKFIIYGGIIIACGFALASIGKAIVEINGLNEMYFGTIIIALATSLPEIVVSLGAVSLGSPDMAVANILGSNIFNMFVVPVMDMLFHKGYLLEHVSNSHIYSAALSIVLTIIIFMSILYRPKKTFMRLGIGTIILIAAFIIGNVFLYNLVHP